MKQLLNQINENITKLVIEQRKANALKGLEIKTKTDFHIKIVKNADKILGDLK